MHKCRRHKWDTVPLRRFCWPSDGEVHLFGQSRGVCLILQPAPKIVKRLFAIESAQRVIWGKIVHMSRKNRKILKFILREDCVPTSFFRILSTVQHVLTARCGCLRLVVSNDGSFALLSEYNKAYNHFLEMGFYTMLVFGKDNHYNRFFFRNFFGAGR